MNQENDLVKIRHDKLREMYDRGIEPFGCKFETTHLSSEIIKDFDSLSGEKVALAGRLVGLREHGKACFGNIQDSGGKIQFYLNVNGVGKDKFELIRLLDIGDFIGISGIPFTTRRGEITVELEDYSVLAKSLRPLPEKWHGLKDVELRYRQRYLDLIANEDVKKTFVLRSKIIQSLRNQLNQQGFLEVETPTMSSVAGGASARPFLTHHNALGTDLYLRIATELHLKRLLVGGMDKVYELGKVFRNEGISTIHNPEFTSLEIYQAYADYYDMMNLTEKLIVTTCEDIFGKTVISYEGKDLDFTSPWPRLSMVDAVKKYGGIDFSLIDSTEKAVKEAKLRDIEINDDDKWGNILAAFFEKYCEEKLIQPTFIKDYPVEVSPLAKTSKVDSRFTERFEVFVAGKEIANAFSELNDPIDQRKRFEAQLSRRQKGDEEAHMMDEDFLVSLEYGMPPAGGLGIGIDRLIMLLSGSSSIRDVILFPTLKPRHDFVSIQG